ncbi:hypothetical protein XENOCAPTIV_022149 [Xenoophorus captivus]|uniref:Uncharacterized protein n=1 Tax=Xenoophorus captivus TaxID=1517983 RepID=A0ABV0RVU2_9TELE
MCLWDIESAKCEHRHNISRNLVTHVCWVPASFSVVQTSEDKTIRYSKSLLFVGMHLFRCDGIKFSKIHL